MGTNNCSTLCNTWWVLCLVRLLASQRKGSSEDQLTLIQLARWRNNGDTLPGSFAPEWDSHLGVPLLTLCAHFRFTHTHISEREIEHACEGGMC